jgi:sugar lactone lactonase YvrE
VDADGCYWTAANSGAQLVRYTPQGKIDRTIALPIHRPTMPCFGGDDFRTIYVTSMQPLAGEPQHELDGSILAVRAGVTGLPEPRFAG